MHENLKYTLSLLLEICVLKTIFINIEVIINILWISGKVYFLNFTYSKVILDV